MYKQHHKFIDLINICIKYKFVAAILIFLLMFNTFVYADTNKNVLIETNVIENVCPNDLFVNRQTAIAALMKCLGANKFVNDEYTSRTYYVPVFNDIGSISKKYSGYIISAKYDAKIIKGYDNKFFPNNNIKYYELLLSSMRCINDYTDDDINVILSDAENCGLIENKEYFNSKLDEYVTYKDFYAILKNFIDLKRTNYFKYTRIGSSGYKYNFQYIKDDNDENITYYQYLKQLKTQIQFGSSVRTGMRKLR